MRLALLTAVLMLLPACRQGEILGYSTTSIYPRDISTVAVNIFENSTFSRGVEFELADAMVKEIEARTPYKVTDVDRADSIITGSIRRVDLEQLSKSRFTGLSEEVILSVTIDFEWRDLRSSKVLAERRSFAGSGLFVPSQPTGEPIELGRFAAVQELAGDIVSEMQAEW